MKRARKPEKASKKEKRAEDKSKRSKKRRTEENKQPNKVEVVHDLSMEEKIMAKLAEFDKKRAEEKRKRSNREKRIEEMLMRIEKIVSKIEEQVAGDGMKKVKRTKKPEGIEVTEMADNKVVREMADNEAGGMTKKKVVTWRLSQELLDYLRTKEVIGLLATETEAPLPPWANIAGKLFPEDPDLKDKGEIQLKEKISAAFQENREFDAHFLYQYRTKGYVEIEEEVSDEEVDVEGDGILVCKERARKPEKPSKEEKGAAEKSKRSNQEKRTTEEKNKQPNMVEVVHVLSMEEKINAELAEVEKNKKKRLVKVELNKALMEDYLFEEVLHYMVVKPMDTFRECDHRQIEGICNPYTDARHLASLRRSIETQANVLQQYRTNGSAVIQFEATDDNEAE